MRCSEGCVKEAPTPGGGAPSATLDARASPAQRGLGSAGPPRASRRTRRRRRGRCALRTAAGSGSATHHRVPVTRHASSPSSRLERSAIMTRRMPPIAAARIAIDPARAARIAAPRGTAGDASRRGRRTRERRRRRGARRSPADRRRATASAATASPANVSVDGAARSTSTGFRTAMPLAHGERGARRRRPARAAAAVGVGLALPRRDRARRCRTTAAAARRRRRRRRAPAGRGVAVEVDAGAALAVPASTAGLVASRW